MTRKQRKDFGPELNAASATLGGPDKIVRPSAKEDPATHAMPMELATLVYQAMAHAAASMIALKATGMETNARSANKTSLAPTAKNHAPAQMLVLRLATVEVNVNPTCLVTASAFARLDLVPPPGVWNATIPIGATRAKGNALGM